MKCCFHFVNRLTERCSFYAPNHYIPFLFCLCKPFSFFYLFDLSIIFSSSKVGFHIIISCFACVSIYIGGGEKKKLNILLNSEKYF